MSGRVGGIDVVIAPDSFKASLSAAEVARHLDIGIRRAVPHASSRLLPVADGGEGTVDAAIAAGFEPVACRVSGPDGRPVTARYARRGSTAVVEIAAASGLTLVTPSRRSALRSSTLGTGQLIAHALDRGATRVVLGLGGSATNDGGAGLLTALGARWLNADGGRLSGCGGAAELTQVAAVDLEEVHRRTAGRELVVACDVDSPLLGEHGAATVFGPQKGAGPAEVARIELGLGRLAAVVAEVTGQDLSMRPGTGAAGGAGYAAVAVLGATVHSGIALVLDLLDFDRHAATARLVVTGEGHLDAQSLRGKAPIGVAVRARALGVPTVAVAGRISVDAARLAAVGVADALALSDLEPDPARSMSRAPELLLALGAVVGRRWLSGGAPPT